MTLIMLDRIAYSWNTSAST